MIRVLFALLLLPSVAFAETVRVAVTTSFHNSGLSEVMLPKIEEDIGIEVQLLVVGTGQAIRLGQAGDVDAIFVHARTAEEAFVTDGYGTHRTEIMYNDFVLVGPSDDPAKVVGVGLASQALGRIAAAQADFISRGDDSGTHKKERSLWTEPPKGAWYKEVGAGMGAALNTASGLGAYILTDRASWLNFRNKGDLALLFEGDPALFNQYAFLPVNPDRHAHVKQDAVRRLEAWLVSDEARDLIDDYQIDGQQLFTFNARR